MIKEIKARFKFVYFFLLLLTTSFGCSKKNDTPQPVVPPPVVVQTLKEKADFNIGAAVSVAHLKEPDFANAFKNNFNQLAAEYEMKMESIWTSLTSYSFDNADYLVNFASQNSMSVHGHTLLWYNSFPNWFKNAAYDSMAFENNVKTYIQTVVGRYKGKIGGWDVANEIFADDGSLRADATVYKTFKDPIAFYGRCFQYARNSDPGAKLFYNDYDMVLNSAKRQSVKEMVERFKKEGYPIDGIGEQLHTTVWTNKTTINNGLKDLASTGLLIHISELDVRVNQNKSDSYVFSAAEEQNQADVYKNIVEMYEALPKSQKYGITLWGVTDKYTWITGWWSPKEYPLLFDNNYNKKKAYYGFLSGLI